MKEKMALVLKQKLELQAKLMKQAELEARILEAKTKVEQQEQESMIETERQIEELKRKNQE